MSDEDTNVGNLNDESSSSKYGDGHERSDERLRARDAEGLENGHDSRRPDPPVHATDSARTDVDRLAQDGGLAARGDEGSGQQAIPGLAIREESLSYHSGPLPDPQTLAAYDHVAPGTAEWIVRIADRQANVHADAIERRSRAEVFALKGFTAAGVLIPVFAVAGGVLLSVFGQDVGWVVAVVGLVPAVLEGGGKLISSIGDSRASRRSKDALGEESQDPGGEEPA